MSANSNQRKCAILYVDHNGVRNLWIFAAGFSTAFADCYCEARLDAALRVFERHKDQIGVLLLELRWFGEQKRAIRFLKRVRDLNGCTVVIGTTAYVDVEQLVEMVNTGVSTIVSKPWDPGELRRIFRRAQQDFEQRRRTGFQPPPIRSMSAAQILVRDRGKTGMALHYASAEALQQLGRDGQLELRDLPADVLDSLLEAFKTGVAPPAFRIASPKRPGLELKVSLQRVADGHPSALLTFEKSPPSVT